MHQTIANLPPYLRRFCVDQAQVKYTSRDHAAWRFIMRQSREFFRDHALPIYLEGLAKTGITMDQIPRIEDMDKRLRELGWGAVPVCGFIPPAAFLDFQARKILPIATDMRSVDHIHYTPAPDIVHEAAGHAPILADPQYSDYLTQYAAMAQKALFSCEDLDLYEAIRSLSDIKENPDSTRAMIQDAEAKLTAAVAALTFVSEANQVARMNWWTVEYGLLGSLTQPKIYGAGLLSSVGESQNCLTNKVKKIRLSTRCIDTSYDITEPQPQLFVAEDIQHLKDVLSEFEHTLAYKRGGIYGLEQAKRSRTVSTVVLGSGLQISGQLVDFISAAGDRVDFLRFSGPVQLALRQQQLPEHGVTAHPHGFSTPLGRIVGQGNKPTTQLSNADLATTGVQQGKPGRLEFVSGFIVEGDVIRITRFERSLALITWRNCRVVRHGEVFFEPAWGDFDMAIGEQVLSVYGGPADREQYGSHDMGRATTTPGRKTPFTPDELQAFSAYQELRDWRAALQQPQNDQILEQISQRLKALVEQNRQSAPREWLLQLECLELAYQLDAKLPTAKSQRLQPTAQKEVLLAASAGFDANTRWLIQQGLKLAAQ